MAIIQTNTLFPYRMPQDWKHQPPVQPARDQPALNWEPLFWMAVGLGTAAVLRGALKRPAPRRCGTCGKTGHDTRQCSQNVAKRVRLRIAKTGWCSCCNRPFRKTEGHHYAGPADGTKGCEMCGTCHFVCGHRGNWQNMAINPRYCRL
jgi:hypothetical protein